MEEVLGGGADVMTVDQVVRARSVQGRGRGQGRARADTGEAETFILYFLT